MKIIPITGISGVGKTIFIAGLLSYFKSELLMGLTATTRTQRASDLGAVKQYWFINELLFKEMEQKEHFLESELVHKRHYGTLTYSFYLAMNLGKDLLLDIDPKGANNLFMRKQAGEEIFEGVDVFPFFLHEKSLKPGEAIDEVMLRASIESNLKRRGDNISKQEIEDRVVSAVNEYSLVAEHKANFHFLEKVENNTPLMVERFEEIYCK